MKFNFQPLPPPPLADDVDSDGEDKIKLDSVAQTIGQDSGSAGTNFLETLLAGLPPRSVIVMH